MRTDDDLATERVRRDCSPLLTCAWQFCSNNSNDNSKIPLGLGLMVSCTYCSFSAVGSWTELRFQLLLHFLLTDLWFVFYSQLWNCCITEATTNIPTPGKWLQLDFEVSHRLKSMISICFFFTQKQWQIGAGMHSFFSQLISNLSQRGSYRHQWKAKRVPFLWQRGSSNT